MTELVEAVLLGLVIGGVLGGLGGGGAILTVPALVYVLGQSPAQATTGSLVIVGVTAVVAAAGYVRDRRVRWRTGLVLGVAGIPAAWLGSVLSGRADPDLLLLGFASLMLLAAATMLRGGPRARRHEGAPEPAEVGARSRPGQHPQDGEPVGGAGTGSGTAPGLPATLATALGVGLLTGFFGVGGGFVVVPALVVVLRLPMTLAVGTSLVVVTLNSATSLLARVGGAVEVDWSVVAPFTIAAVAASFAGKGIADRLAAEATRRAFAALLVVVAAYVAWHSTTSLLDEDRASSTSTRTDVAVDAPVDAPVDVPAARRALAEGVVVLDVRTPEEYAEAHVVGAFSLDLSSPDFEAGLDALDPAADHVVYCASGRRAAEAIALMRAAGFSGDLVNGGGLDDLADAGVRTS